jgi:hypothetical protein
MCNRHVFVDAIIVDFCSLVLSEVLYRTWYLGEGRREPEFLTLADVKYRGTYFYGRLSAFAASRTLLT